MTDYIIVCELKGSENSNPVILDSYPLDVEDQISVKLVPKFLPFGSKAGDYLINRSGKNTILSYIFKIENSDNRADLLSISMVLGKKEKIEIYKLILKEVIDKMGENKLLTEEILKENIKTIYQGVYDEKDITIDFLTIKLSKIYVEAKLLNEIKKPKIKGSFSI